MDLYLKIASLEADYERLANVFRQGSVERAKMRKRIAELELQVRAYKQAIYMRLHGGELRAFNSEYRLALKRAIDKSVAEKKP